MTEKPWLIASIALFQSEFSLHGTLNLVLCIFYLFNTGNKVYPIASKDYIKLRLLRSTEQQRLRHQTNTALTEVVTNGETNDSVLISVSPLTEI